VRSCIKREKDKLDKITLLRYFFSEEEGKSASGRRKRALSLAFLESEAEKKEKPLRGGRVLTPNSLRWQGISFR